MKFQKSKISGGSCLFHRKGSLMKLSAFVVAALASIVLMVGCADNTAEFEAAVDRQMDIQEQREIRADKPGRFDN